MHTFLWGIVFIFAAVILLDLAARFWFSGWSLLLGFAAWTCLSCACGCAYSLWRR